MQARLIEILIFFFEWKCLFNAHQKRFSGKTVLVKFPPCTVCSMWSACFIQCLEFKLSSLSELWLQLAVFLHGKQKRNVTDPQGQTVPAGCDVTTQKLERKKKLNRLNIWSCNNWIKSSGKYLPFVWDSYKQQRKFRLRLLPVQWSCDFSSESRTQKKNVCTCVCVCRTLALLCSNHIYLGWEVEQRPGRHKTHRAGHTLKTDASCQPITALHTLCWTESFSVHFIKERSHVASSMFQTSLRVHSHQTSGLVSEGVVGEGVVRGGRASEKKISELHLES